MPISVSLLNDFGFCSFAEFTSHWNEVRRQQSLQNTIIRQTSIEPRIFLSLAIDDQRVRREIANICNEIVERVPISLSRKKARAEAVVVRLTMEAEASRMKMRPHPLFTPEVMSHLEATRTHHLNRMANENAGDMRDGRWESGSSESMPESDTPPTDVTIVEEEEGKNADNSKELSSPVSLHIKQISLVHPLERGVSKTVVHC
jgi:hypothetical protein